MQTISSSRRSVQRLRHDAKIRLLEVLRIQKLTPHMMRVTFGGKNLPGFYSAAHDDHVKLFFPASGSDQPILPSGPPGTPLPEGAPRPIARDYTPRRYDASANELDIDFVLHSEGPATLWAAQATPGQWLGVGGPRGSFVASGFDWYVLIGDEAALPAISRRLEELPANVQAIAIVEVENAAEEQPLQSRAPLQLTWVHRSGAKAGETELLIAALKKQAMPSGDGYVWIAGESSVARTLRQYLITQRGLDKEWIKAAGYWKHGASAIHEKHEE